MCVYTYKRVCVFAVKQWGGTKVTAMKETGQREVRGSGAEG